MKRISSRRAQMAIDVLEAAKDAGDAMVIAACRRVRQAWLLGRKAACSDLDLIEALSE